MLQCTTAHCSVFILKAAPNYAFGGLIELVDNPAIHTTDVIHEAAVIRPAWLLWRALFMLSSRLSAVRLPMGRKRFSSVVRV